MRRHPILLAEVVSADGSHRCDRRVFCDLRARSVSLDVCRACASCVAIDDGTNGQAAVHCAPALEIAPDAPPPSGRSVQHGVVAVDGDVLVRDVVALFVDRAVRVVVVTDTSGRAEGVVHESQLVRQIQDYAFARDHETCLAWESVALEPASAIMRPATTVLEDLPLRAALASMATAHQRQLVVVDDQGVPVGVLVDVDALHALYGTTREQDK